MDKISLLIVMVSLFLTGVMFGVHIQGDVWIAVANLILAVVIAGTGLSVQALYDTSQ